MIRYYLTVNGTITEIESAEPGCWISLTHPNASETELVASRYHIDLDDLRAPLDEEERSRIETEDNYTVIVVDIPAIEERNGADWFVTLPLGIFVTEDVIITVCLQDTPVLSAFTDGRVRDHYTFKKTRFILQILYKNAQLFLQYLRIIDRKSEIVEKSLHKSQRNKELIELLELEKTLVYFTTSLKGNEMVLEKLLKIGKIKKYPEDEDLLEDVIVENKQAIEMANIYSGILSGTMDAFASVISNNQNIVMKTLSAITIVLSIPNIITGLYGMNVANLPFEDSPVAFGIICLIIVGIAIIATIILKKKDMF